MKFKLVEAAESKICCICKKPFDGYGNNAEPVCSGSCCDECNMKEVIPARLSMLDKSSSKDLTEGLEDYKITYYLSTATAERRPETLEDVENDWIEETFAADSDYDALLYSLELIDDIYDDSDFSSAEEIVEYFEEKDLGDGSAFVVKLEGPNGVIYDMGQTKDDFIEQVKENDEMLDYYRSVLGIDESLNEASEQFILIGFNHFTPEDLIVIHGSKEDLETINGDMIEYSEIIPVTDKLLWIENNDEYLQVSITDFNSIDEFRNAVVAEMQKNIDAGNNEFEILGLTSFYIDEDSEGLSAQELTDQFMTRIAESYVDGDSNSAIQLIKGNELDDYLISYRSVEEFLERLKDEDWDDELDESLNENSVSGKIPPALDNFLQDIAQMFGTIDYGDIMDHDYTEDDIRKLNNLRRRFITWAQYDEDDEEIKAKFDEIANKVAEILKRVDEDMTQNTDSNVQYGVHRFSTDDIIFRGSEEECGEYINDREELWDDAEVYRMTPDDPHYKLEEAHNDPYFTPYGYRAAAKVLNRTAPEYYWHLKEIEMDRGDGIKLANYALKKGLPVMLDKNSDPDYPEFYLKDGSSEYHWGDYFYTYGFTNPDATDLVPYEGNLDILNTEKDDVKMNESKNNTVVFIDASSSMIPYQDAARRLANRYDTDKVFYFANEIGGAADKVGYATAADKVVKYINEHPNYDYVIITDDDTEIGSSDLKNLPNVEIVNARTAEDDEEIKAKFDEIANKVAEILKRVDEDMTQNTDSNVQYGVHRFSTDDIIFRGSEEECGEYINDREELWDDAEVYRMTPDDPHYKLEEAHNDPYFTPYGYRAAAKVLNRTAPEYYWHLKEIEMDRGDGIKLANYALKKGLPVMLDKNSDPDYPEFYLKDGSSEYHWGDYFYTYGFTNPDATDLVPYEGNLDILNTEKDDVKMNESKNNTVVFIDASSSMIPYQDAARRLANRYDTDKVFYFANEIGGAADKVGYATAADKVVKYINEHPNYDYVIITDDDTEIGSSDLKNLPNVEIVNARTAEDDEARELAIKDAEKNISDEQRARNRFKIAKILGDDELNEDMSVRAKLKALYPELDFGDRVEETINEAVDPDMFAELQEYTEDADDMYISYDSEYADYINDLYMEAVAKLEKEFKDLFIEPSIQGTAGAIFAKYNADDGAYETSWNFEDELEFLDSIILGSSSEEDYINQVADFIRTNLETASLVESLDSVDDDMDFDINESDEYSFMEALYKGADFDDHDDEALEESSDCEDDECWENDLVSEEFDDEI